MCDLSADISAGRVGRFRVIIKIVVLAFVGNTISYDFSLKERFMNDRREHNFSRLGFKAIRMDFYHRKIRLRFLLDWLIDFACNLTDIQSILVH